MRAIVSAVCATEMNLRCHVPQLQDLPLHTPNVTFITTQELEDKYPDLTPKERENAFAKENGTTFLMKIGGQLKSGKPHDGRAPDYDDWDLNGDMLFWHKPLAVQLGAEQHGHPRQPREHGPAADHGRL